MDTAQATQYVVMYFVVPVWLAAGIADYICHRASNIARTSGPMESLIHLLMLAEIGIPVLLGLTMEINALVIGVMILAFFAHEATALWDVSFAVEWREVTPIEQHVHSFLELIPLMALSLVIVLNWDQFLALFGYGSAVADFSIQFKEPPLPIGYVLGVLAAIAILEILPFAEELWRCLRANRGSLTPPAERARSAQD